VLILSFFILFVIYNLIKYKEHFIVYTPIFTITVDILPIFITRFTFIEENFNIIILSYFRVGIFLALFAIILIKYKLSSKFNVIFILLIFLLIKPFFTANPYSSFKVAISVISFVSLFVAGFIYFSKFENLSRLVKPIRISLLIYLLNSVVFTLLKIGHDYYGDAIIFQGSMPLFSSYGIMYSILFLISQLDKLKKIDFILIFLNISILILLTKRTPVLLLIIGLIIILGMNRNIYFKSKNIGNTMIFLLLSSLVFYYSFVESASRREEFTRLKVKEAPRYLEYVILYDEIVKADNIFTAILGKDLFVEKGRYGLHQDIMDVIKDQRRLHSDYAILLYGGGIIGLGLYLYIFIRLFRKYLFFTKTTKFHSNLKAIFLAILICLFINGFVDSLTVATARAIPYLYLGGLLGTIFSLSKKVRNQLSYYQLNSLKLNN